MKHVFIYITLFFAFSPFVFAQEQEVLVIPQKQEEIKKHIEEKRTALQSQIQEKQEEIQEQIRATSSKPSFEFFTQERTLKIISRIFEQFEAVLVKFDGIIIRIEARITKLNEQGISTLPIEELLLETKIQIKDSTALIIASKIELEKAIATEISKEEIKNTIEICKTSLKNTQTSLINVIVLLKNVDTSDEELLTQ